MYVKDIIKNLTLKGFLYYGKTFATNTVYKILKNERYAGIYRYNNEVFNNIYPQIIDSKIFEIVRKKLNCNRYGKRSEYITYLLKDKMVCGYCGKSIIGENGTAKNGERKYYYTCSGRKRKINDCKKSTIRKEVLEKVVLDCVIGQLKTPNNIDFIVNGLMHEQQRQSQANFALNIMLKEQRQNATAINNIMTAIENGGTTNTITKRLRDLETRQEELQHKYR